MKIRTLGLFALVFCMMLAFSTDAFAFGKRGKGLFGWREGGCSTCSSGQCGSAQGCATGCENGQCAPSQSQTSDEFEQVCVGGKCYLVRKTPAPTTKASETITLTKDGDAWKDGKGQAWKVSK